MVLSVFYIAQGLCKYHGKYFTPQPSLGSLTYLFMCFVNIWIYIQQNAVICVVGDAWLVSDSLPHHSSVIGFSPSNLISLQREIQTQFDSIRNSNVNKAKHVKEHYCFLH